MKDDLLYTPSDCFETFAFPESWRTSKALNDAGELYYRYRATLMADRAVGLTKMSNRFHDPNERDASVMRLRELHSAMDRVVLGAYGWTDIQPRCEFILDYKDEENETPGKPSKKTKPWRYRWPDEIRDEVLGRLLGLNAQRAKAEARAGAADPSACRRAKKRRSSSDSRRLLE